ncbi:MAG: type II secretion system protein [Luteolibacter sp.]
MKKNQNPNRVAKESGFKNGFTLVEILVVIVIIAVLAGLSFVFVGKAMAKAGSAACMNNLRQMATATQVYAADNNGKLPMADTGTVEPIAQVWEIELASYIGIEADSSDEFPIEVTVKTCPTQFKISPQSRTYSFNRQFVSNRQGVGSGKFPVTISQMSRPGKVEAGRWPARPDTIPTFMCGRWIENRSIWRNWRGKTDNVDDGMTFPHSGACNMCFLDGHIEAVKHNQGIYDPNLQSPQYQDGRPAF